MRVVTQRVTVPFEYPVIFTERVFEQGNEALRHVLTRDASIPGERRAVLLVERRVAELWPKLTRQAEAYFDQCDAARLIAAPMVYAGGEACKNDERAVEALLGRFSDLGLDRHSHVLVVGGGAFQDFAGFAASIAHRGLRVVRLPTTVLSQNDSGVGVKNAVNAFNKKNYLGTFAPPYGVIDDFAFLSTLDARDRVAGIAEAVKVALIKDKDFFQFLSGASARLAAFEPTATREMIERCAILHLDHIATSGDPFEQGSARPLDFGHWAAHKLESLSGYSVRHGEAVAIGIAIDMLYAAATNVCSSTLAERVLGLLEVLGFCLWHPALAQTTDTGRPVVLDGIEEFREHIGGALNLLLIAEVGAPIECHSVQGQAMAEAVARLRTRYFRKPERARADCDASLGDWSAE